MNPFSTIFGAGVAVRNALYDRGILKARRLACPVISVGNISVGGSGKTPFVIALGRLLKDRGIAFDVLSRGYGRRGRTVAVVDSDGSPEQFGDEPLLIARKLQVPVIVGASRYQAGLLAERKFAPRLHLMDDGFQHRGLHRDFDIVMLPASDMEDTLLPGGRLREPVSALRRADALVVTGQLAAQKNVAAPKNVVWRARRQMIIAGIEGKAIAFCGIARPEQFFFGLSDLGIDIAQRVFFPDHHRYTEKDTARLLEVKARAGAKILITTEKDLINLGSLAASLEPLQAAEIVLWLEDPNLALSTLFGTLERRSGCRF
jgi:tetraacyldisaccharide 4'-kinase